MMWQKQSRCISKFSAIWKGGLQVKLQCRTRVSCSLDGVKKSGQNSRTATVRTRARRSKIVPAL